jgi:hypothetical protein
MGLHGVQVVGSSNPPCPTKHNPKKPQQLTRLAPCLVARLVTLRRFTPEAQCRALSSSSCSTAPSMTSISLKSSRLRSGSNARSPTHSRSELTTKSAHVKGGDVIAGGSGEWLSQRIVVGRARAPSREEEHGVERITRLMRTAPFKPRKMPAGRPDAHVKWRITTTLCPKWCLDSVEIPQRSSASPEH